MCIVSVLKALTQFCMNLYASVTSLAEYNETTILITNTQQGHNTNDHLEGSNKPDIQHITNAVPVLK